MSINNNKPLVSIVVITYNSSTTVIETLDSIKDQTYQNIELIITDDKSTDNTVQVCETWLKNNNERFVHSKIVTTEINTGVSGNLNRGVRASKGEWIKSIAGDDLLIPAAIEEYVKFVKGHTEDVKMCVSDVELFSATGKNVPDVVKERWNYCFHYEQEPYQQQIRRVCRELVFTGPTFFYKRELFNLVGGFSEEYGNAEEWPFVYKVLKAGGEIYAIKEKLVLYRVSDKSLCNARENGLSNYQLFLSTYKFFFDFPFRDLVKGYQYLSAWDLLLMYETTKIRYLAHNNIWINAALKIVQLTNPYAYIRKIKSILV